MENKTLYQKLHIIQSKINGLGKDGKSFGYQYVTGTKVLSEIKPLMNELGIILKQEVLSIENERQDYSTKNGSKSEILSKVMMRFTWIDTITGEKDENSFGANGQNDWEKGLGSALTYAERYFLLKFFHIATDEDDIDNSERKPIDSEVKQPIKKVWKDTQLEACLAMPVDKLKLWLDAIESGQYEPTQVQVLELKNKYKSLTNK